MPEGKGSILDREKALMSALEKASRKHPCFRQAFSARQSSHISNSAQARLGVDHARIRSEQEPANDRRIFLSGGARYDRSHHS